MNCETYKVFLFKEFRTDVKALIKRYQSLRQEIDDLIVSLATHPRQGTSLGNGIYKIRLAIKSKGKGKSSGARVMTFVNIENTTVTLFFIYNKGDRDTVSDKELQSLVQKLQL